MKEREGRKTDVGEIATRREKERLKRVAKKREGRMIEEGEVELKDEESKERHGRVWFRGSRSLLVKRRRKECGRKKKEVMEEEDMRCDCGVSVCVNFFLFLFCV